MKKRELEQLTRTGGSKEEKENVRTQYNAQIKNYESSLELTELDVKELEETIQNASIVSEIEGTVTAVDTSFVGGYANDENVLVTVRGAKKNRFHCKTDYASHFKNGQKVTVTAMGQQYKAIVKKGKGKHIYLYPQTKLSLSNGQSGTIDLVLQEKKDVLYLPTSLVYDMGGKKIVYVEGENSVKEMREITTGIQIQNQIEVTGGLKENEQVLTS
jgi:hypothetical protein